VAKCLFLGDLVSWLETTFGVMKASSGVAFFLKKSVIFADFHGF